MADWYVCFTDGNDSTGDGSSGTPWKTIQKGINDSSWGDTINISDKGAHVLTTGLTMTGIAGTNNADNPIIFKAWDNGGTITVKVGNVDYPAFEIDGNDAVATAITGTAKHWVYFYRLKIHDFTGFFFNPGTNWLYVETEMYNGAGTDVMDGGADLTYKSCYFHDSGAGVNAIQTDGSGCSIQGCVFENIGGSAFLTNADILVEGNVFKNCDEKYVNINTDQCEIHNNAFIGDGSASEIAIRFNAAAIENADIFNNIFIDFSGTGSTAIDFNGGSCSVLGHNAFKNNTANYTSKLVTFLDLTAADVTETSEPFANKTTMDVTLASGALSRDAGLVRNIAGVTPAMQKNIGPWQADGGAAAGGGGSGVGSIPFMA